MFNWKRIKFVLSHAADVEVITLFMLLLGASMLQGTVTGLFFLIGKEFGEFVGKAKASGTFVNNFAGNLAELKDALDDKWQLWQTVGAATISAIVNAFVYHFIL